jgi:hypothetical protein
MQKSASKVFSHLIAATATFALNASLWFRQGRLAMVFSSLAASCRFYTENPLIPAVQISGTTSAKRAGIRRAHLSFATFAAIVLAICLIVYPWPTLIAGNCIYLALLPYSYLVQLKDTLALQDDHAHSLD